MELQSSLPMLLKTWSKTGHKSVRCIAASSTAVTDLDTCWLLARARHLLSHTSSTRWQFLNTLVVRTWLYTYWCHRSHELQHPTRRVKWRAWSEIFLEVWWCGLLHLIYLVTSGQAGKGLRPSGVASDSGAAQVLEATTCFMLTSWRGEYRLLPSKGLLETVFYSVEEGSSLIAAVTDYTSWSAGILYGKVYVPNAWYRQYVPQQAYIPNCTPPFPHQCSLRFAAELPIRGTH